MVGSSCSRRKSPTFLLPDQNFPLSDLLRGSVWLSSSGVFCRNLGRRDDAFMGSGVPASERFFFLLGSGKSEAHRSVSDVIKELLSFFCIQTVCRSSPPGHADRRNIHVHSTSPSVGATAWFLPELRFGKSCLFFSSNHLETTDKRLDRSDEKP